jgi:hypothetical protein
MLRPPYRNTFGNTRASRREHEVGLDIPEHLCAGCISQESTLIDHAERSKRSQRRGMFGCAQYCTHTGHIQHGPPALHGMLWMQRHIGPTRPQDTEDGGIGPNRSGTMHGNARLIGTMHMAPRGHLSGKTVKLRIGPFLGPDGKGRSLGHRVHRTEESSYQIERAVHHHSVQ